MSGISPLKGLSTQDIAGIGAENLNALKPNQGENGLQIQGRHFTYTFTMADNGQITASVKSPFYAYLRCGMRDRASERADRLAQALTDRVARVPEEGQSSSSRVGDKLKLSLTKVAKDPEVPIYGKCNRTAVKEQLKAQGLKAVTIDQYNRLCGIRFGNANSDNAPGLLAKLRSGDLSKQIKAQYKEGPEKTRADLLPKLLAAWKPGAKEIKAEATYKECIQLAKADSGDDQLADHLITNCDPDKIEPGLKAKLDGIDHSKKRELLKDTDLFKEIFSASKVQTEVSQPRLEGWASYLEKNVDRLDVLAKCKTLAKVDDGGVKLAKFLIKNCPPEKLKAGLKLELAQASSQSEKLNLIKETDLFKALMQASASDQFEVPKGTPGFDSVLQYAFFRTTSKMGLEFFASEKLPIAFWKARLGVESDIAPMNPEEMRLQPWKDLGSRDTGATDRAESITYSELRYVERLKGKLEDISKKEGREEMAKFSSQDLQIVPVQIKNVLGTQYVEMDDVRPDDIPEDLPDLIL